MAFKPDPKEPDLSALVTSLNNSKTQTSNNALYQTIYNLINAVRRSRDIVNSSIEKINNSINNTVNNVVINITSITNATYWTKDNESASLPNSRQVIAGSGITLDYTVANQVTVSSTGGSSGLGFIIMSNGDEPPQPMGTGDGNFLLIPFDYVP